MPIGIEDCFAIIERISQQTLNRRQNIWNAASRITKHIETIGRTNSKIEWSIYIKTSFEIKDWL